MAEDPCSLLIAEDGHPIGDLVIATDESVPGMSNDTTVEENRREVMAESAKELTGNPDADAAVAELYPGHEDMDKRQKAMRLYIAEAMPIEDVAKTVDVPARTVAMWIYEGKWDELVKKELSAYNSRSVTDLARLRAIRRLDITKEQLEQAKKIREEAMARIDNGEGSLKSNTESWAAAAKIEHTLAGVSEAGTLADIDGKNSDQDKSGKQPLVMVFQGGGLPPIRKHNI